ncbi:MAG: hypothetical protein Q4P36_09080 [Bowdeniella nasicola]|nr:hypothetical protein [Bowdeniella nasicola]
MTSEDARTNAASPATVRDASRTVDELLAALPEADLADHPEIFTQIHARLQRGLSASAQADS